MNQEIANKFFWSEEGQFVDILYSTSDDVLHFTERAARYHIHEMELEDVNIQTWLPEYKEPPPDPSIGMSLEDFPIPEENLYQ